MTNGNAVTLCATLTPGGWCCWVSEERRAIASHAQEAGPKRLFRCLRDDLPSACLSHAKQQPVRQTRGRFKSRISFECRPPRFPSHRQQTQPTPRFGILHPPQDVLRAPLPADPRTQRVLRAHPGRHAPLRRVPGAATPSRSLAAPELPRSQQNTPSSHPPPLADGSAVVDACCTSGKATRRERRADCRRGNARPVAPSYKLPNFIKRLLVLFTGNALQRF